MNRVICLFTCLLIAMATSCRGEGWRVSFDPGQNRAQLHYDGQLVFRDVVLLPGSEVTVEENSSERFVVSRQDASTILRRVFEFSDDDPCFLTWTELCSRTTEPVRRRSIEVFEGTLSPEFLGGDNVRKLVVPFDNDKWIRYRVLSSDSTGTGCEVGAIYDNHTRRGVVAGSIDHDTWKTGVSYLADNRLRITSGVTSLTTRDTLPHGEVSGSCIRSARVMVGCYDDWRSGMEHYGDLNAATAGRRSWNRGKPVGWNSWGKLKFDVTPEKLCQVSDFVHSELPGVRSEDGVFYTDVDSGWNRFSDDELRAFVQKCKENGQIPGAYLSPWGYFSQNCDRPIPEMPEYTYADAVLRAHGVIQRPIAKAACLDPSHPAVIARRKRAVERIKSLGFEYLKIDFLTTASVEADNYYDKSIQTGMQAYNYAMKQLRELIGDDLYVTAAISPLLPGCYVHSRRIACDAWHKIKQTEYTLNATTYGWWLSHVYCYNDPDHLVLEGVSEGENRARLTSGIVTGLFLLGDDFSQGGDPRTKERARRMLGNPAICTLAASRSNFRPVEHGSDKASNAFIWLCDDGSSYLALFNYDKTAYDYTFDLERLGLSPGTSYRATELWSGRTLTIADRTVQTIGAKDSQLFRLEPFTE